MIYRVQRADARLIEPTKTNLIFIVRESEANVTIIGGCL